MPASGTHNKQNTTDLDTGHFCGVCFTSWPLCVLFRNFPTDSMTQFPEVTPKYCLVWGLHPREPQLWRGSRQVLNWACKISIHRLTQIHSASLEPDTEIFLNFWDKMLHIGIYIHGWIWYNVLRGSSKDNLDLDFRLLFIPHQGNSLVTVAGRQTYRQQ